MTSTTAKVSQLIACTPDAAFEAFADPARIVQFWLDAASAPLSPGGSARWHFKVPGAVDTVTVAAFEPPGLIAIAWSDGSKLRLEFRELSPGRTRVSAEFDIAPTDTIEQVVNTTEGFSIVLCDLKTFLESGRSANLVRAKADLIASDMGQACAARQPD